MSEGNYWQKRVNRRRFLRGAALGGAGLTAAAVIGCGDDDEEAAPVASSPAATAAASPGASAPGTPAPAAKRGGTLIRPGPIGSVFTRGFDPHVMGANETAYTRPFYQGLVRLHPKTLEVEAELGQKWEQVSPTELIFTLAPGVKFHNKPPVSGRDLTAEDVVYSLNRARTDSPEFFYRSLLASADKIEAVDKSRVRITTKAPDSSFVANLSEFGLTVIAREVIDKFGAKFNTAEAAIGTGPFVLKSFDGNNAELARNEGYWKAGLPYMDGINLVTFKDPQARWAAFVAGQIDIAVAPGPEAAKILSEKKYTAEWFTDQALQQLWFNTQKQPFGDPRVTRALRLLMDHQEYIPGWVEVFFGKGSGGLISHFPHSLQSWDFTQQEYASGQPAFLEWKVPKDDAVKEALTLLGGAGFTKDNPLKFTLHTNDIVWLKPMAELLQAQYKRLSQGVVDITDLKVVDVPTLDGIWRQGDFEASGPAARVNSYQPDHALSNHYHSKGAFNYGKYSSSKVDSLIEKQRQTFDVPERKKIIKEILAELIQTAPVTAPTWRDNLAVAQPRIKGGYMAEGETYAPTFQYERLWLEA